MTSPWSEAAEAARQERNAALLDGALAEIEVADRLARPADAEAFWGPASPSEPELEAG